MRLRLALRGRIEELDVQRQDETIVLRFADGRQIAYEFGSLAADRLSLRRDGKTLQADWLRAGREIHLHHDGRSLQVHRIEDSEAEDEAAAADPVLRAPMPGRVLEILVRLGEIVRAGMPLLRVEAMKMQVDLTAPVDGKVHTIHVRAGELVEPEASLVTIEPQFE
jgi:biotin carboxyl carrier protein